MAKLNKWMQEVLSGRHIATLATHNDDGTIHITPVWYLFENGRFYFGTQSSSRKARNAIARPNATIMIEVRQLGSECWVYASGPVEAVRGDDSRDISSKILQRYLTKEALEDPRIGPAFAAADDIAICLLPETWRSWNKNDLDQQFFGGVLGEDPSKWFRPIDY